MSQKTEGFKEVYSHNSEIAIEQLKWNVALLKTEIESLREELERERRAK